MSIHELNQKYADEKGSVMLRGRDGYDNYFLLGTFPEFGARMAMRARNLAAGDKGTKIGFKLRISPIEGAEYGNWAGACPDLKWAAKDETRCSACFGIGLAAWTRAEVAQAIIDVDYPQVLDNWLTALGLTWDAKQRELLPAYLAEAEDALFSDDFGEGVAPIDVEGRISHAARSIQPEDQIWYSSEYADNAEGEGGGLFDEGGDEEEGADEAANDEGGEDGDPFA